jgi:hypothetical protein
MQLPKLSSEHPDMFCNFSVKWFWGTTEDLQLASINKLIVEKVEPSYFFADNMLIWGRNNSMFHDSVFVKAWELNAESVADKGVVWRRYILACAAYHCMQLEGDFVECGCYTGVGVKTVIDYLGGPSFPKNFWAYDLFEHSESSLNPAMPEHSADLYDRVVKKFADYPQVKLLRGSIPDVFSEGMPDKISYLHIDLNQAPAEIAALDALFDKVVSGGIIILDDYEWSYYRSQKIAEDPWFDERKYRVFPLPTGQGLVLKR